VHDDETYIVVNPSFKIVVQNTQRVLFVAFGQGSGNPGSLYVGFFGRWRFWVQPAVLIRYSFELPDDGSVAAGTPVNAFDTLPSAELQYQIS
jgi:hypothetical protein